MTDLKAVMTGACAEGRQEDAGAMRAPRRDDARSLRSKHLAGRRRCNGTVQGKGPAPPKWRPASAHRGSRRDDGCAYIDRGGARGRWSRRVKACGTVGVGGTCARLAMAMRTSIGVAGGGGKMATSTRDRHCGQWTAAFPPVPPSLSARAPAGSLMQMGTGSARTAPACWATTAEVRRIWKTSENEISHGREAATDLCMVFAT